MKAITETINNLQRVTSPELVFFKEIVQEISKITLESKFLSQSQIMR